MRQFSAVKAQGSVIGIDLGTTNSCVAVMEGKVGSGCFRLHGAQSWPNSLRPAAGAAVC